MNLSVGGGCSHIFFKSILVREPRGFHDVYESADNNMMLPQI